MIVSASFRTDIAAFHGPWFLNRLEAGDCLAHNPISGIPFRVSLRRQDVDGFVFWTKNPLPFMEGFCEVRRRGFPFYVQLTINGYPRNIEANTPCAEDVMDAAAVLCTEYGRRAVVWRYDPVLVTRECTPSWHCANFRKLAQRMSGFCDEVCTGFVVPYYKTRANIVKYIDPRWEDPGLELRQELASRLYSIAAEEGIELKVCAQPDVITVQQKAVCTDYRRLNDLGAFLPIPRKVGNRPGCQCAEARDIGEYDTCRHGCVYCYANKDPRSAVCFARASEPGKECIVPVEEDTVRKKTPQMSLGI